MFIFFMHKRGAYICVVALMLVLSFSLVSAGWLGEIFGKITGHPVGDNTPKTYYISTTGDNSNSGTVNSPFKTIQKGVNLANEGDTVIVKSGTYTDSIKVIGNGILNKWITIKAETPGATILKGSSGEGISIGSNNQYFIIDGFEITGYDHGISLDNTNHIILRNNILRSNKMVGIQSWKSNNILVEKNQFLDPNFEEGSTIAAPVQDYGVNFYYGENHTVINNYFFGKGSQDVSFKKGTKNGYVAENTFEGCMYTCVYLGQNDEETGEADLYCRDIIVEKNVFQPAAAPYRLKNAINVRNVKNATIRSNFFEGMDAPGDGHAIIVWNDENGEDAYIYNNVVINTPRPAFRLERATSTEVYYNTLFNTWGITIHPEIVDSSNIVYGYDPNTIGFAGPFTKATLSSRPTPQFTPNFSRAYAFKLKASSSLIDKVNLGININYDFDRVSRPQGSYSDRGAFEYKSQSVDKCSDGTVYGTCSNQKPLYCNAGSYVNSCSRCGCPIVGQTCQSDETCKDQSVNKCFDGTIYGACSITNPQYCNNGNLINNCSACNCSVGQTCQSNGNCKFQTECNESETKNCSTGKLGICSAGIQTCGAQGQWGDCIQSEQSSNEVCNDNKDNDCDGSTDCSDLNCEIDSFCVVAKIKCYNNLDCPSINLISTYCQGNSFCTNSNSYECVNPGTSLSDCNAITTQECVICENGCDNNRCIFNSCDNVGVRKKSIYCSGENEWVKQKENKKECINSFECISNYCDFDKCSDEQIIQRVINWIKEVF